MTLLCCCILLIGGVRFSKVDITPPPSSVFCKVFPIFDADICGLEMSLNDIFLSQLLPSSASFPILELTIEDNTRNAMGFYPDNMPTPSELDTSKRSLNIFHASSSEHFHVCIRYPVTPEYSENTSEVSLLYCS